MLNALNSSRYAADPNWRHPQAAGPSAAAPATPLDSVSAHFQREAARLLNASDLMADPTSLELVQKALGFQVDPAASHASQADLINSMINFHDFQIPSKIQQFIELYSSAGQGDPAVPHVTDSVLQGLQSLRVGGV